MEIVGLEPTRQNMMPFLTMAPGEPFFGTVVQVNTIFPLGTRESEPILIFTVGNPQQEIVVILKPQHCSEVFVPDRLYCLLPEQIEGLSPNEIVHVVHRKSEK
jgi:hypothetical protein